MAHGLVDSFRFLNVHLVGQGLCPWKRRSFQRTSVGAPLTGPQTPVGHGTGENPDFPTEREWSQKTRQVNLAGFGFSGPNGRSSTGAAGPRKRSPFDFQKGWDRLGPLFGSLRSGPWG